MRYLYFISIVLSTGCCSVNRINIIETNTNLAISEFEQYRLIAEGPAPNTHIMQVLGDGVLRHLVSIRENNHE